MPSVLAPPHFTATPKPHLISRSLFIALTVSAFFSLNLAACLDLDADLPAQVGVPIAAGQEGFYTINLEEYPDAVCNDGSPGAFIYRRGQDDGINKWVLILQGGGACSTADSCEGRAEPYKSSIPWEKESLDEIWGLFVGILNPLEQDNPHFYNWNHVVFIYCSSDAWVGQRTIPAEPANMPFSGHLILEAIIAALQDEGLIGVPALTSAQDVLFGGSSAGAAGVRSNIDWVAELLQSAGIDAKFRGILDAGVGPLHATDEVFEAPPPEGSPWQSFIDADCAAAHAATNDPWECTSGEYLLANNFITTPLFVYHDQRDRVTKNSYRGDDFDGKIAGIVSTLPNVFSPDAGFHYILTKTRFFESSAVFPSEFIAGYENSLYLEVDVSYTFSDLLWLWYSQQSE